MSPVRSREVSSLEAERRSLAARLKARRDEIEQSALTRVNALSPPSLAQDPQYLDALRTAVGWAIDYGLASIERGQADPPPIPYPLLWQAQLAVRSEIPLDTVLRRYLAGFTLLNSFIFDEAEQGGIKPSILRKIMQEQSVLFESVIEAIATAYAEEAKKIRRDTSEQRWIERIQKLLDGELVDTNNFDYDFAGHHVGVIGTGDRAEDSIRQLASNLDCRLLLTRPADEVVWGWMGSRRPVASSELQERAASAGSDEVPLAVGEPGTGLPGWRLTHRQAKAALPIAVRREKLVRYGDVALLATLLQDDLLATSLRELYLMPFEQDREGGKTVRDTLRAYFAAGRNVSSAAAALGVSRQTVSNRLRAIEERLGQPLSTIGAEIEIALRFDVLDGQS